MLCPRYQGVRGEPRYTVRGAGRLAPGRLASGAPARAGSRVAESPRGSGRSPRER
jgi:hypothetical protein